MNEPPDNARISIDTLGVIPETLLIPLLGRAQAHKRFPQHGFRDEWAEYIVAQLDFDPERFASDRLSMEGSIIRAQIFDDQARAFFARYPQGLGVSVGAGLDARFQRLDNGHLQWVDLDVPEVIAIKRQLLPETERYRLLSGSLTAGVWMDQVGWERDRPILILSEGVLLYFSQPHVRTFFVGIADHFTTGATLLFDFTHPLVRYSPITLRAVSRTNARFRWGLRSAREVAAWHPRLRFVLEKSVTRGGPRFYDWGHRWFRLTTGHYLYAVAQLQVEAAHPYDGEK